MKRQILADSFFGEAVKFALDKFADIQDKVILDSGCGSGEMTVLFAMKGARVIGTDSDHQKISMAKDLAESYHLGGSCSFLHESSEETSISAGSVDIIFSMSTIQYMDKEKVFKEYLRILKPGGSVALLENLPHNPFVNMYRLARRIFAGTNLKREYIQSIKGYITNGDIEYFGRNFAFTDRREFHLFHVIFMYLKLSRTNCLTKKLNYLFTGIDRKLLNRFPFSRKYAWLTAVFLEDKVS